MITIEHIYLRETGMGKRDFSVVVVVKTRISPNKRDLYQID